jgi:hypothetical protein
MADSCSPSGRMIWRREHTSTLLLGGAVATWPFAARVQQVANIPRVGFLGSSTPGREANLITPFREGLRDLGYEEGRNLVVEYRWAEGRYDRFPALIAELIGLKVDLIVTAGTPATLAVKKVTTSLRVKSLQCTSSRAVGGTADMRRTRRAYRSDANSRKPPRVPGASVGQSNKACLEFSGRPNRPRRRSRPGNPAAAHRPSW